MDESTASEEGRKDGSESEKEGKKERAKKEDVEANK